MAFTVDLPELIASDLTEAFAKTGRKGLGAGSYQGPSGHQCFFIVEKTKLGGGQALDTAEYPFQGGWGTRSLNKKVQTFSATVSICGSDFMSRRNSLIEALDQTTDDDAHGVIALPSWGRLPVVVQDWEIEEDNQKQRLSTFTLTFVRAGLSTTNRNSSSATEESLASPRVHNAAEHLRDIACVTIDRVLPTSNISLNMISAAFSEITGKLQALIGRIQAPRMILDLATSRIQSLISLIAQGVTTPKVLAQSVFGCYQAIASAVIALLHTENLSNQLDPLEAVLNGNLNGRKILCQLLADDADFTLPTGSVRDAITLEAIKAIYWACVFYICGLILPSLTDSSLEKTRDYFSLFCTLEEKIDRSDPDIYLACSDLRTAVNTALCALDLTGQKVRVLSMRMPILPLSWDLSVPISTLESLNDFEDLHAVIGEITYV